MKVRARQFAFRSVTFTPKTRVITFRYTVMFADGTERTFRERLVLPRSINLNNVPPELLQRLLQELHRIIGVSYYKLFFPRDIEHSPALSPTQATFWNTVYRRGLGEFLYRNRLDPRQCAHFPVDRKAAPPKAVRFPRRDRVLVGVGGGKESIVTVELLKAAGGDVTAFVVETERSQPIIDDVLAVMDVPVLRVRRMLDPQLFDASDEMFQGHIPISAMTAWIGFLLAALHDYRSVIVGNEWSSSVGNVRWKGEDINHQWSKSEEFERLFGDYTRAVLTPDIAYFSLLRPFTELRIAKMFAQHSRYHTYFSSCNRQFTARPPIRLAGGPRPPTRWCGTCPKCAFVFLLLAAVLPKQRVLRIVRKNLLDDPALTPLYRDLLGFGDIKPFDCVGTFEEARAALWLARKRFGSTRVMKEFIAQIRRGDDLVQDAFRAHDAPTIPPHFRFFGMRNALLLGYGKEGKTTRQYLRERFPRLQIGIADASQGMGYLRKQELYDIGVKTPGMPRRLVTMPYTTATNMFFSEMQGTPVRIVGVTGTKGKSTTTTLIRALLRAGGYRVRVLGNIGVPMLDTLRQPIAPNEVIVLELSSHQLDDLRFSPHVAVVLNLFPEHIPYHGNVEAYYAAKKNSIAFQQPDDVFFFNPHDAQLREWAERAPGRALPWKSGLPVTRKELPVLGDHNVENVRAAVAVARLFGVSDAAIRRGIQNFHPLPHRLERIGTFRGITFYDDAISTTPESTIAALRALPNVGTIFLGGEDRGYDFRALERELRARGVKNIVLFPKSGKRVLRSRKGFTILETRSMDAAVRFAYRTTPAGQMCLLSTASPSYTIWKNFEAKGEAFQRAVRRNREHR